MQSITIMKHFFTFFIQKRFTNMTPHGYFCVSCIFLAYTNFKKCSTPAILQSTSSYVRNPIARTSHSGSSPLLCPTPHLGESPGPSVWWRRSSTAAADQSLPWPRRAAQWSPSSSPPASPREPCWSSDPAACPASGRDTRTAARGQGCARG